MPRWLGPVLVALSLVVGACGAPFGLGTGLRCTGLADQLCQQQAAELGFGSDASIVGIELTCTQATCTAASGEVQVAIRRADGRVEQSGMGWQSAGGAAPGKPGPLPPQPAPALPAGVTPSCIGVPEPTCGEQASSALDVVPPGRRVMAIVVRCTAACDASTGQGTTTLTLDDGSTTQSDWAYQAVGGAIDPPVPDPSTAAP